MPSSARRRAVSPTSASNPAPTIIHGTANFGFQRPSFWANDFFLNKAGTPRPDFMFNTWGGSFSGPVRITQAYNGKNKTFFLFGYEGIHDSRPRHDDTTNPIP